MVRRFTLSHGGHDAFRSIGPVRELVHLRCEIRPRDAFAPMPSPAFPVEASTPDVHLAELLAERVDVELEPAPRLRELRDVEVRVDGVLARNVLRFRSLAHGSVPRAGVRLDCSLQPRSAFIAARAAWYPLMPCTPTPGGVDDEQRNTLSIDVLYGLKLATGRV